MKIIEFVKDISLAVNNEEADLLQLFVKKKQIPRAELDARQQVVANQLVIKDVLTRKKENGKIIYQNKV